MDAPKEKKFEDPFGRTINYLRLSVTDRCNLRCKYCMPEKAQFTSRDKILTLDEIYSIATVFTQLGVDTIRLTGGEPLIRKNILWLVQSLARLEGLAELTLTTNAMNLSQFADKLKSAGLTRINISLDSLNSKRFKEITRVGELMAVKQGIDAAIQAGFHRIRLNSVILRNYNDDEVVNLTSFAINKGIDIAFIEEMPLGKIDTHQRQNTQVCSEEIREKLSYKFDLKPSLYKTSGPSNYFTIANTKTNVGFISPISNNFCSTCNRIRVTASGRLLLCLGNEHSVDLRAIIREAPQDRERLKQIIVEALKHKPDRHYFNVNKTDIVRFMNTTGG